MGFPFGRCVGGGRIYHNKANLIGDIMDFFLLIKSIHTFIHFG